MTAAGGLSLAPAGPAHAGVIAALHGACFTPAWDEAAVAALLATPGCFGLLVATGDSDPVGFVLCRQAADEAEILAIGSRPGFRRRGAGGRLLDAACTEAATLGARRMVLEVAEDDAGARTFYARHGFAAAGRRRAYYERAGGEPVDALILAAPLCA